MAEANMAEEDEERHGGRWRNAWMSGPLAFREPSENRWVSITHERCLGAIASVGHAQTLKSPRVEASGPSQSHLSKRPVRTTRNAGPWQEASARPSRHG